MKKFVTVLFVAAGILGLISLKNNIKTKNSNLDDISKKEIVMDNTYVVNYIVEKTEIDKKECEEILKAIEKRMEKRLVEKFKGIKYDHEAFIEDVSIQTGYTIQNCQKVTEAFHQVVKDGILKKLL